ncbi:AB hydrolase-1 domain-containing protein [Bordetella sputigena]|uniref:alpha/beta fold hydrolase n=1 Tax=Bordetella sputigena TaxID=1416810 RepID=UPI0039F0807C
MSATGKSTIALRDFGSFYAGGRPLRVSGEPVRTIAFTRTASLTYDPNGHYHIEHAYVQYFIPAQLSQPLPLVLLHGGGMTGAMWEQTPDGRTGWLQALLRLGHAVYVVDNVERGRAGWVPFASVWPESPIIRNAEESWSLFRFGAAADYPRRKPFPGQRFPTQAMETFIQHAVPRWLGNNDIALDAFCAVLERVGPCIVVAHSHGGEVAWCALQRCPQLVRAVIGIEPSGFSEHVDAAAVDGKPFLFVYGDFLDATPLWRDLVAAGHAYGDRLAGHGGKVSRWLLAERGVRGNSHMMMMDDNSDEIAARVSGWIREHCLPDGPAGGLSNGNPRL